MNSKHQTFADDEIDLREVILTLWKEKLTIFIITLIFTVAGYYYGTLQPKVYQTTITLRDAPVVLFERYRPFLQQQQQQQQKQQQQQQQTSIATNFNQEFKLNLTSLDHLIRFVEQNKKLDAFKSYLKKNNTDIENYFQNKFQPRTGEKVKPNQYSFTFSKPFPIEDFLSDYVFYTKQTTVNTLKKQLKLDIESEVEVHKQNLEIAKKIDLKNPFLRSFAEGNFVVNEPGALFYKGTKVLSQHIINFEKLLNEIETLDFEYNLILESPKEPSLVSKPITAFLSIAFVLGFFLSLIFIFLRSLLSK